LGSLTLQNIHKSFGSVEVLKGIDLVIDDGELTVFVGPSGCGKSTLLRIVAGLEEPTSGSVLINRQDVTAIAPAKRGIAMVFQTYALYPHLNVQENMSLGLKQTNARRSVVNKRVSDASAMLSLENLLKRMPADLSGGQRQRVAIGRAIVREPELFLFDEPLSNLDAALRVQTRLEIARLHHELNATMVYVTHDQIEAMTLADRIVVMDNGVVQQIGTPMELYNNPRNRFVAGFIGSPQMNFIDALALGIPDAHIVGIRPEHIQLRESGGDLTGSIRHVEHLGADTNIYIQTERADLVVIRVFGEHYVNIGDRQSVAFDADRLCYFDEHGDRIYN